jgi:hypothetical protein
MSTKTTLNIGLVGCGFMGSTHSNAFAKVNQFFELDARPVLKTACARNLETAEAFARNWGYEASRRTGALSFAGRTSISSTSLVPTIRIRRSRRCRGASKIVLGATNEECGYRPGSQNCRLRLLNNRYTRATVLRQRTGLDWERPAMRAMSIAAIATMGIATSPIAASAADQIITESFSVTIPGSSVPNASQPDAQFESTPSPVC